MLRDAKLGRFDVLLVYRVDRLARSIRGLAQIIDELDQAGVIFRSATEPFDTGTPAGRMMVQMLGVFAEFERALIVERITAGLERKAARGGWCGGQRPYGLNIAADRNSLERNPTEAPLVPVMFDRYANRKAGSSALADWLNEQGYRTNEGGWSKESVITVILNCVYTSARFTTEATGIRAARTADPQRAVRQGAGNSHRAPRGSLQAQRTPPSTC